MKTLRLGVVCAALTILFTPAAFAVLTPQRLTLEDLIDPPVVDVVQPRLSWVNHAPEGVRAEAQTAYQIRVASSPEGLESPDLWDSGKVDSNQSIYVPYEGEALKSRQECWWQVRVWNRDGEASAWSDAAHWRMGLLDAGDWQAKWIGAPWRGDEALPKPGGGPDGVPAALPPPAPLLRKEFQVDRKVAKAVAYVTGLGYFELYVNGAKIGNDELVPNQTNYGKRPALNEAYIPVDDVFRRYKVMYLAYDITDQLESGANAVGGILGNGFYDAPKYWTASYGSPRFLAQIHVTYEDGGEDVIVSDESWRAAKSAIVSDLVFHGEHYDARLEQPGWNTPGFDAANWEPVALRNAPDGELVAHMAQPDRVTLTLPPVSIEKLGAGHYKVDFGVEISGRVRLNKVQGPAGHKIEIAYNGNLYSGDHSYIFRGEGPETYASRFNWFVFSGIEITNWPGELKPEMLTAEAVNTDIEETAVIQTSNPLFNTINEIWQRSQLDNMHGGLASDCPHRERNGYTGDGQCAVVTVIHNYDARPFYRKWIADMYEAQNPETGYVPNGAPWQPGCGGGPAWGAAICIMPWEYYVHYGDTQMLADNYEAMKGYVDYMHTWVDEEGIMFSKALGRDGEILMWLNLGDWCAPGEAPPDDMVHTFYLWRCEDLTAKSAAALGKPQEAARYAKMAQETKAAFFARFYDAENETYGIAGGNIFALRMGVPEAQLERVVASLKADIEAADGHLDTGILGTKHFFEVLAENGLNEYAYAALDKRTRPSFGAWIEVGATTTREAWDDTGSHNHPMFGGGIAWLYRKLAGMNADPANPGYRHIIFRPQPAEDLEWLNYSNLTPYGRAGIAWKQEDAAFEMAVQVPVGARATVYVPAESEDAVSEGGLPAAEAEGIGFLRMDEGYAVYAVGSGNYAFTAE